MVFGVLRWSYMIHRVIMATQKTMKVTRRLIIY